MEKEIRQRLMYALFLFLASLMGSALGTFLARLLTH